MRSIKIKQSTPEEMRILIDQAHQRGMTTTSHLSNYAGGYDVGLNEAIRMGLDRVEHWSWGRGGDPTEVSEMIDMFLAYDVFFTANLQMYGRNQLRSIPELEMVWVDEIKFFTPYAQSFIRERMSRRSSNEAQSLSDANFRRMVALKALYEAGGGHLILVGTDNPTSGPLLSGFAYHRELQALVYAGLPPVAALKAATINGARALGVETRLGSIEPGKLADLYVVAGQSTGRYQSREGCPFRVEERRGLRSAGPTNVRRGQNRSLGAERPRLLETPCRAARAAAIADGRGRGPVGRRQKPLGCSALVA